MTESMNFHRGPYLQRGKGLGNILGSLFRAALPVVSSIGRSIFSSPITRNLAHTAKKAAIDTGLNVISDVVEGKNLGESVKDNLGEARSRIAQSLRERPKPTKKRKNPGKKAKAPKKKKYKQSGRGDLFDI